MIKNIRELEEYLNISNDPPEGSRECFNELIDKLEKQKQEIEKLKTQNGFSYFVHQQILEDYISKDKIKERIKNAEILKHNYLGNNEVSAIVYKDIIKIIDAQINVLKELLEE